LRPIEKQLAVVSKSARVLGTISVLLLVGASVFTVKTYAFVRNSVPSAGRVLHVATQRREESVSSKRSRTATFYRPTVVFTTADRTEHEVELNESPESTAVGESIPILVDRDDPTHVSRRGVFELWPGTILFGGGGLILGLLALGCRSAARTLRRRIAGSTD